MFNRHSPYFTLESFIYVLPKSSRGKEVKSNSFMMWTSTCLEATIRTVEELQLMSQICSTYIVKTLVGFDKSVYIDVQTYVCCLGFRRTQLYPFIFINSHSELFWKKVPGVPRTKKIVHGATINLARIIENNRDGVQFW